MRSKMKVLGRETRCYYADSKANKTIDTDWFQRGIMNVRTVGGIIASEKEYSRRLQKKNRMPLSANRLKGNGGDFI